MKLPFLRISRRESLETEASVSNIATPEPRVYTPEQQAELRTLCESFVPVVRRFKELGLDDLEEAKQERGDLFDGLNSFDTITCEDILACKMLIKIKPGAIPLKLLKDGKFTSTGLYQPSAVGHSDFKMKGFRDKDGTSLVYLGTSLLIPEYQQMFFIDVDSIESIEPVFGN